MSSHLTVDALTKRYSSAGPPVLDDVSFAVSDGAFACLLGPSGTGKSTLLGCIAGLVGPDTGRVAVGDRRLDGLAAHLRPVTLLFQRPQLFAHLSVLDNVAFGLRVRGVARRERRRRAAGWLDRLGMAAFAERSPRELSGGEAQRVALARALAVEPAVLLLDEPLTSLDPPVRRELQDLLVELQRELGTTTILVTHDVDEGLALGDQLLVLDAGRIVADGPPIEVFADPGSAPAARLLGFSSVPARPGRMIRPDHVRVGELGAPMSLAATVTTTRFAGATVELTLDVCGEPLSATVPGTLAPRLGDMVGVVLPPEHIVEVS